MKRIAGVLGLSMALCWGVQANGQDLESSTLDRGLAFSGPSTAGDFPLADERRAAAINELFVMWERARRAGSGIGTGSKVVSRGRDTQGRPWRKRVVDRLKIQFQ